MVESALFFVHYALLLIFGISLSFAFAGINICVRKNILTMVLLFVICGLLQLFSYFAFDEETVWKLYPVITHLPIILLIFAGYKKRFVTSLAAVFSAYLCCQPANWAGILIGSPENLPFLNSAVQIVFLAVFGILFLRYFAPYLSEIFQKDTRSIMIFGSVPIIYYLFDYAANIYTDYFKLRTEAVVEFLPLFICLAYMCFCIVYYKEYEQKADAERKEQIIRISIDQQAKEIEAARKSEEETRLLRHDMRLLLSTLSVCIDGNETEKAKELLSSYIFHIEQTKLIRFCKNDTVNYVLSDFCAKCKAEKIDFDYTVETDDIDLDEIPFCSILSNALDNAFNAQKELSEEKRKILLLLKTVDGKLLLSVKNPVKGTPVFVDGIPVTNKKDHGYGTQSIHYMAEKLGGNSQFVFENGTFITRVII